MNILLASVLAAGELVCDFPGPYRQSVIAGLADEAPRNGQMIVYEAVAPASALAISSLQPGRRAVQVEATNKAVHFIQPEGASARVTTLTGCERWRTKKGEDVCVRFAARHAWHFDATVYSDPDAAFAGLPAGAATGSCEPWQVD
jgi:hypothetical protein